MVLSTFKLTGQENNRQTHKNTPTTDNYWAVLQPFFVTGTLIRVLAIQGSKFSLNLTELFSETSTSQISLKCVNELKLLWEYKGENANRAKAWKAFLYGYLFQTFLKV